MGFVLAFGYLLRALVRDWRVAIFGTFLLAYSGGMAMQMRTLRTELLAAGLFYCALLLLVVVATRGQRWWRPAVVGLASLLLTLAMLNKVQVVLLICALPILLLPFGPDTANQRGFWAAARLAWPALAVAATIAALAAFLAADLVCYGPSTGFTATLKLPTLSLSARTYWGVIAVWIGLGFAAYCVLWKVPTLEALTAALAAIAGCMVGLLAHYARYHPNDVVVTFHPMEQMFNIASSAQPALVDEGSIFNAKGLHFLIESVAGVVARRTFILESSPRPTIFLEWFVIAATVIAIRRRRWTLVWQVASLMLTVWCIDTFGMSRGLKQEYFLFTDPLVIIAAALLITNLVELQYHRWTFPLGVTLIAVTIVFSQAESVKHMFKTDGPEVLCGLYPYAKRLEHLPICKMQMRAPP